MLKLVLIRGVPGSGKTTLACQAYKTCYLVEADQFFLNPETGEYKFDPEKISEAHAWCQNRAKWYLKHGLNTVVANTFTRLWEMGYYVDLAKELGAELTVVRCEGRYPNSHGCPEEHVQKMRDRFEDYPGEFLFNS